MKESAARSGEPVFVAEDCGVRGAKSFATFPSHNAFLRTILESSQPCFYELIPEGKPCKLYFDIEWRTELTGTTAHTEDVH
jgi:hypothetical protein